jgi:hypothetical protein
MSIAPALSVTPEKDSQQPQEMWLSAKEAAELLGISWKQAKLRCSSKRFSNVIEVSGNGGRQYRVALSCLNAEAQAKYYAARISGLQAPEQASIEAEVYARAPEWARRKADKYQVILRGCEGLKGDTLKQWIGAWNLSHPEMSTSFPSVLRARATIAEHGISGLLAQYGNRAGETTVRDDWFDYFKKCYLKEGAPSAKSCWLYTLGYARQFSPDICVENFPSEKAFSRRLSIEIPEASQYLARYGESAWNKKYATYLDRDYSNVKAGEIWVGDAFQIDINVMLPNGKIVCPWGTIWRDMLTSKWLGWIVHAEAPTSDHVFESFHYGIEEFGLCKEVLIDNGKTYRCRDFAGGRKNHLLQLDEVKTTSMLGLLGITPRFSLPYGAQSKPIERDFLKFKELLSKHVVGYRGGNVVEKPEKLEAERKAGTVMHFAQFVELFNDFIVNVLNKNVSQGKNLLGKSPDQLWAEKFTEKREVSRDALALFCMRTSNIVSIHRNGIKDSDLGVEYFAEWMPAAQGAKVYIRRSLRDYSTAWVFRADTDECLGTARINALNVPAFARTTVEKTELQAAMELRRRDMKIAKSYISNLGKEDPVQQLLHLKSGVEAVAGETAEAAPQIHHIADTAMDKVVRDQRERELQHTGDLSNFVPPSAPEKKPLYLFESEAEQSLAV